MFFLLAIKYHDPPPCLLSVLLKDCTRKMIPVQKNVTIKHKCVLKLMFIKGSLQTLHVVHMWLRIEINSLFNHLLQLHGK